jgi:predicted pyridoxine 5'-phosphate oxidase superfamily flavin-nucleotide-binding protein
VAKKLSRDDAGFHPGEREMQRRFDSEALADRIAGITWHDRFTAQDRDFIERMDMFFLATADADGNLDCSYKGGDPGFVRVLDETTLVFPNYDGNGTFMSMGNLLTHAKVGMLFVDFERQHRMRVNGTATIDFDDPLAAEYQEAQFVVRVTPEQIFPNCPRYIHKMQLVERSRFVPKADCPAPDPDWKAHFEDVLPETQRARRAAAKAAAEE